MSSMQLTFHGMKHSEALEALIAERVGRLDRFSEPVHHCRVVVDRPPQHHRKGTGFSVHAIATVPGTVISVSKGGDSERYEDPHAAVRDCFDSLERALKTLSDRRRAA